MLSDYFRGKIVINVDENKAKYISKIKSIIERDLNVKITVTNDNSVIIEPKEDTRIDELMKSKSIIEAINYGFQIDDALLLKNDDYILDVIDLRDYIDKNKTTHLTRIKGRIIGENGKARKTIEELTDTKIVISNKCIAMIGNFENVRAAREAIEMLIRGRQHVTVYRWLQGWRRELKRRRIEHMLRSEEFELP